MAGCACGENWIVESCDLASGRIRRILHPQSLDWQTDLNKSGQGSLTLTTKEISSRDIWPGLTSIYISRVTGADGASRENPVCEFAGYVDQIQASENNTTQLGLRSIDHYLSRRTIKQTASWDETPQTIIGRDLVQLAEFNGIPLFTEDAMSSISRDREYEQWNYKNIGEAVEQLTNVINGPDWELRHTRSGGQWSTTMIFRDYVGEDRGVILQSDRELSAYSITIDQSEQATWVDAIGEGEEEDQLHATAIDYSGIYPEFDAVPAWTDVSRITTLQQHADGYLESHQEPDARPTVSIVGLVPDPSILRLGDTVDIRLDFGLITYHGKARIISISWGLSGDEPETRTLEVVPLERASQSILNQVPNNDNCKDC